MLGGGSIRDREPLCQRIEGSVPSRIINSDHFGPGQRRTTKRCCSRSGFERFEALRDWECFDADTDKDSARNIREYFIPDFSNWKDQDSYKAAFERLLRD